MLRAISRGLYLSECNRSICVPVPVSVCRSWALKVPKDSACRAFTITLLQVEANAIFRITGLGLRGVAFMTVLLEREELGP